jgi:hypothetical protein
MIDEKTTDDTKLERLSSPQYKDKIFRLHWIQNINAEPFKNYFYVLFRDIYKGIYVYDKIFPELLSYYTIGSYYQDSELLRSEPPLGKVFDVQVKSAERNQIKKISDVISDKEYNLISFVIGKEDKIDVTRKNKSQRCVVCESERQIVIFPCAVIGGAYYFTSSSMRRQIFAQNLEGLYEHISDIRPTNGEVRIKMKPGAFHRDFKYIIRFAKDEHAKSKWYAIAHNIRKFKSEADLIGISTNSVPFTADFPVKQVLNMTVRGLKFFDKKTGKQKILVFDILKENSSFNFKTVLFEIKGETPEVPVNPEVIPTETYSTSNKLKNETPSTFLKYKHIWNKLVEKNTNAKNIRVLREYTYNEKKVIHTLHVSHETETDMSVMQARSSGDRRIRQGEVEERVVSEDERKEKEGFTLDDFIDIAEGFSNHDGVIDLNIHPEDCMPLGDKKHKTCSLKEFYNKNTKDNRKFIYVTFKYKEYGVCLIEIDQRGLPSGTSTYVLVSHRGHSFSGEDVASLLKMYVNNAEIKEIEKEFSVRDIRFLCKKHPKAKKEDLYERWRWTLLQKI